MKRTFVALVVLALIGLAGCNESPEGGPGATKPAAQKPVVNQTENTFTIAAPTLATSLKQGESKSIEISIDRGKGFQEDVNLDLSGVPKGVTVDPAMPSIKKDESKISLTITAAEDAALGDFKVKATGKPTKGATTSVEFDVTVTEK